MSKAFIYDHTGKQLQEVKLPSSLFDVKISPELMSQAIHVYRSNSHQGTSKAQGRGDVDRTTAKWYKQKGTGRARHGARSAPLFVGGGSAFGPRGLNRGNLKLTQKMKRLSLLGALSGLSDGQVTLVSGLDKMEAKTSAIRSLLNKMSASIKPTILVAQSYPNVLLAASNIKSLNIIPYSLANAYLILKTRHLVIDESALEPLQVWLTGKAVEAKPVVAKKASKPINKSTN